MNHTEIEQEGFQSLFLWIHRGSDFLFVLWLTDCSRRYANTVSLAAAVTLTSVRSRVWVNCPFRCDFQCRTLPVWTSCCDGQRCHVIGWRVCSVTSSASCCLMVWIFCRTSLCRTEHFSVSRTLRNFPPVYLHRSAALLHSRSDTNTCWWPAGWKTEISNHMIHCGGGEPGSVASDQTAGCKRRMAWDCFLWRSTGNL